MSSQRKLKAQRNGYNTEFIGQLNRKRKEEKGHLEKNRRLLGKTKWAFRE